MSARGNRFPLNFCEVVGHRFQGIGARHDSLDASRQARLHLACGRQGDRERRRAPRHQSTNADGRTLRAAAQLAGPASNARAYALRGYPGRGPPLLTRPDASRYRL